MIRHRWLLIVFLILLSLGANSQPAEPLRPDAERRANLLEQLTPVQKIDLSGGVDDFYIRENKRIGPVGLKMADGPAEVPSCGGATRFAGIGMAATWDPDRVDRMGGVIGQAARARGVHFMLGPESISPACGHPNFSRKATRQS